jgi:hypothetical protein
MPSTRRTLCWTPIWNPDHQGVGLEHLLLSDRAADSVLLAVDEQQGPFRLAYRLTWDDAWRLRQAEFMAATDRGTRTLALNTDGRGHWQHADGRAMAVGERREFRMAWVFAPDLTVRPQAQAYTRLAVRLYLFENLDGSGFQAELPVDDDGVVIDYAGLFRRVPTKPARP